MTTGRINQVSYKGAVKARSSTLAKRPVVAFYYTNSVLFAHPSSGRLVVDLSTANVTVAGAIPIRRERPISAHQLRTMTARIMPAWQGKVACRISH